MGDGKLDWARLQAQEISILEPSVSYHAPLPWVFWHNHVWIHTSYVKLETEEEAAVAYDIAAVELRGPNAVTNFDISNYLEGSFRRVQGEAWSYGKCSANFSLWSADICHSC